MNEFVEFLKIIATNPNAGIPVIGVLFGLVMAWMSRGDKANDGKVLDIFGRFMAQSSNLTEKLASNTTALLSVEQSIKVFAGASQEQHATTRAHVTRHDGDITRALEVFGNTQANIVTEMKKIAAVTSNMLGQLSNIDSTTSKTHAIALNLDTKADSIMKSLEASQLGRIVELLEDIRKENRDFYNTAQKQNELHFVQTNARLDNIERKFNLNGELDEQPIEQEKTPPAPNDDNLRRIVRNAASVTGDKRTGSDTGSDVEGKQ